MVLHVTTLHRPKCIGLFPFLPPSQRQGRYEVSVDHQLGFGGLILITYGFLSHFSKYFTCCPTSVPSLTELKAGPFIPEHTTPHLLTFSQYPVATVPVTVPSSLPQPYPVV